MVGEIKEVQMDAPFQEGGKKRKGRTRRKRQEDTMVTKDKEVKEVKEVKEKEKESYQPTPVTKVILAPPRKKPAMVMLVPSSSKPKTLRTKTFKAKQVKVTIDNTAKTRKHRVSVLEKVDAMSDEQIRVAAVQAKLSRPESVAKAPIALLRQMVKDYQTMRRMLL
jgi:hypothetical protein